MILLGGLDLHSCSLF